MSVHVAQAHEIETASGGYFDLTAPASAVVRVEDVAHALANTCRFGGHCKRFYSVAEHAVHVSDKLIAEGWQDWALAGLHHDDAEAYLGDIPRPIKPLLGDVYRKMTIDVDAAIQEALGGLWYIGNLHSPQVTAADNWMLACEALALLPSGGAGWGLSPRWAPDDGVAMCWRPEDAEAIYLDRHHELAHNRALDPSQNRQDGEIA